MTKLYLTTREEWRAWLMDHHAAEKEVWLVYHKRHTGQPRIPYEDAVEEALCFGWIDSIVRRIDDATFAQKFTPRRPAIFVLASLFIVANQFVSDPWESATGLALIAVGWPVYFVWFRKFHDYRLS